MSGVPAPEAPTLPGWPHAGPAFHPGEVALQRRVGLDERLHDTGRRVVRGEMPEPHRELFGKLPFMLLGALDDRQRPWATLLAGAPGFVQTPDARSLRLAARPLGEAVLPLDLAPGAPVGMLGIELSTRRRNRVNGRVSARAADELSVNVTQNFGNCPKYIQRREPVPVTRVAGPPRHLTGPLDEAAAALVAQADTFFIASAAPLTGREDDDAHRGVDVSHRGGKPGFVKVQTAGPTTTLTAPDFVGNFFFNTLGNLALHPWAGLLFIDWSRGDVLSLVGRAQVLWEGEALRGFAGALRLLQVQVDEGWWLPSTLPLAAEGAEWAPQLPATGEWGSSAGA